MSSQLWVVVGGGDKGGIVVREGPATDSPLRPERLATLAVVRELALEGDRLRYERLSGAGPDSGWVSIRLQDGRDLALDAARVWRVVGGGERGGVLVRRARDTASAAEAERLATGAWVRELALEGERLQYRLLLGTGPPSGWVSTRLQDGRELLARASEGLAPAPRRPPAAARRLRVLFVHSSPGNSNIMKFQTTQLRRALGKDVEALFVDAPSVWRPRDLGADPDGRGALYASERSDMEKRLAGDKPFFEWLTFDSGDLRTPTPESVERTLEHLRAFVTREAPLDACVAISQGSCVAAGFLEHLRGRGEAAPWRLSVFFSSVPPENHFLAEAPTERWDHPVVAVLGGEADPWYAVGRPALLARYAEPRLLEHGDGHAFPLTEPRAGEIYAEVAAAVRGGPDGAARAAAA